jgi:hypothetical protein
MLNPEEEIVAKLPKKYECRKNAALKHYKNNTEKCKEYSKTRYEIKKQDEEWCNQQKEKNKLRMRIRRQKLKEKKENI